jgi:hypothetical protein
MSLFATNPNTNPNPNSTVGISFRTPENPSSAYRGMLETLAYFKRIATDALFGAVSADFEIDNENITFTAWFVDDHIDQMVDFAVFMEALLHTSLSGKRLTDEERWKRIQNLAKSFNERFAKTRNEHGLDGWEVVHDMFGKDAIIALGGLDYETEEEARDACAIYGRLGVTETVYVLRHADGWFATAPESHLTAVQQ